MLRYWATDPDKVPTLRSAIPRRGLLTHSTFVDVQLLGTGSFATVVEGLYSRRDKSEKVAVKMMNLEKFRTNKHLEQLSRELQIQVRR